MSDDPRTFKHKYAVLVGVDVAESRKDKLPGCADQASEMGHLLGKDGYTIKLFTHSSDSSPSQNAEPTPRSISDEIDSICKYIKLRNKGNDSFVVFYFAGHGYQGHDGQMLACRKESDDPNSDLRLERIEKKLRDEECNYLLIIDTCRTEQATGMKPMDVKKIGRVLESESSQNDLGLCRVKLFATTGGKSAFFDDRKQKSVFTEHALSVMRGYGSWDKRILWSTLHKEVCSKMRSSGGQTPEATNSGPLDFVIINDHKTIDHSVLDLDILTYKEISSFFDFMQSKRLIPDVSCKKIQERLRKEEDKDTSRQWLHKEIGHLVSESEDLRERLKKLYDEFMSKRI
jgi:hypothetical protein